MFVVVRVLEAKAVLNSSFRINPKVHNSSKKCNIVANKSMEICEILGKIIFVSCESHLAAAF